MDMIYMKERTRDFYFYTLFGVPYNIAKDLPAEDKIRLCSHRAYADLSRTIDYSRSSSWLEDHKKTDTAKSFIAQKQAFKENVHNYLAIRINQKLFSCTSEKDFDEWHEGCCTEIEKKAKEPGLIKVGKKFSYGQAQKWINMTLKYMDISGFWDQQFTGLRQFLHVPVDSYILKASADCKILLPRADGKKNSTYSESTSKKWSNWTKDDYKAFIGIEQKGDNNLRRKTANLPDWEDKNWILTAWKNSAMYLQKKK